MSYVFDYAAQYGALPILNTSGIPQPGVTVTVYLAGTQTLATLYTDRTKATQAGNPTATDNEGNLTFFADPGQYTLEVAGFSNTVAVEIARDPAETTSQLADPAVGARISGLSVFLGP